MEQIGFDCSPEWEPFDRRIAERVAQFARRTVWENAHALTSSGYGMFRITPENTGLCHIINAVGASALRRLLDDRIGIQVHPVVARWVILDPAGEPIGVSSWGDEPSFLDGRFHAAVACVDRTKVYEENGVTMLPTAYVDFALADVVGRFQSTDRPNRLAVGGDLFCSWDNRGQDRPAAVYTPPRNFLESGPFLDSLLGQDEEVIEKMGEQVAEAAQRLALPFWRRWLS